MPRTRSMTMKTASVLCALLTASAARAASLPEARPRIALAPGSQLMLRGKSTLHDYASAATRMELAVELVDALPAGASPLARLTRPGAVKSKSQPIEVDVRASETPEGIVLEGSRALLMSDFGIKPPTMFLGTLKTADRVVVEWRLVLTNDGF